MAIPTYEDFMLPILKTLSNGLEMKNHDLFSEIAKHTNLTDEEMKTLLPSGQQYTYVNRINWALTYMGKAGLIMRPRRAVCQITQLGKELLNTNPERVDNSVLIQYKTFQEFKNQKADESSDEVILTDSALKSKTPQEIIENAYAELNKTLASELLEEAKKMDPALFERLVVDLLLAMGYGGSRAEAGKVVGKTGDGGIDGVIDQDKLGLDKIYIQAKRWEGNVGKVEITNFVGSLVGFHADKGVFITTSSFNKNALEYVVRAGKNIILIDGHKLAELMIEHNVGVNAYNNLVLRKVDYDYFNNEE